MSPPPSTSTAAALVAAIAIALPDVGGTGAGQPGATDAAGGDPVPESGQASELAPSGEAVVLEVQNDMNYDARSLERLAEGGDRVAAALSGDAGSRDSPAAVRCVTQAFEQQPVGRLTRLIETRFEGRDAYIAVYLEGPGAGEPADTAVAWVASQDDCTILSFAQARL